MSSPELLVNVVPSFSSRATDKSRSILKECSDNLSQAVGSLPPTQQSTSAQDDPMDTSSISTAAAKKVSIMSSYNSNIHTVYCPGSSSVFWPRELCSLLPYQ